LKYSLSNLSWGETPINQMLPRIKQIGFHGVEIAPTAIWPEIKSTDASLFKKMRYLIEDNGLEVSALQSLLYGNLDYQLFSRGTWLMMKSHLEFMFTLAKTLGASVVVFGSPRNRLKGELSKELAHEIAAEFFATLLPSLERNNLVMTLEPNASEYGADYLLNYSDVRQLSSLINSPHISPQIDTGCLWMVGEEPSSAFRSFTPHHIHISNPNLGILPGESNFKELFSLIRDSGYKGWLVIETLGNSGDAAIEAAQWLRDELGKVK
jgi:D-psicose/D-tagatose/L-ribulose 3-epimerase